MSITAIHGVDDTLKAIATQAVEGLTPKPKVTVAPLGSGGSETARVNWFLYRIDPNPAYRNMEPPRTGWRTARGRPPLALVLHYLLTAFPAGSSSDGDYEQFSHSAIAAVMQALHEKPIIGEGDPLLSSQATPLVEPLRITLDALDLEGIAKIWTAAGEPIRLSVGYAVSLVCVQDPADVHVAGPPVRERRVWASPTLGPRLASVAPPRASAGDELAVAGESLTSAVRFTLARAAGDPAGDGDWELAVVGAPTGPAATLQLSEPGLVPGVRRLAATLEEGGLPAGSDSIAVTVVPAILSAPATAAAGDTMQLTTAHAADDVEVFLRGEKLANVTFVSPERVDVELPGGTAAGPAPLALRARTTAGPVYDGLEIA